MQEYLLKVTASTEADVVKWLRMAAPPSHVRLSTLAPLSNYGYPPNAESVLIAISEHGVVTGSLDDKAPHDFVPWQNVAFFCDGSLLAREQVNKKGR
jgi:hypothetical protein